MGGEEVGRSGVIYKGILKGGGTCPPSGAAHDDGDDQ
jgi:hypothetical protein